MTITISTRCSCQGSGFFLTAVESSGGTSTPGGGMYNDGVEARWIAPAIISAGVFSPSCGVGGSFGLNLSL